MCPSPVPQLASPDLETLDLMNYYESATAHSHLLTGDAELERVWRYEMPLAAQSYEFLYRSLLGLAALHRAHECPWAQAKYDALALKYQITASKSFRLAVDSVNAENSNAVFGFTVVFAISQLKNCTSMETTLRKPGIDMIIDAISSLRSGFALAIKHEELFKETCFSILPKRVETWPIHTLDENTEQALEALDAMNLASDDTLDEKLTNTHTIQSLRLWYSMLTPYPKYFILRWLMTMPSDFVHLLSKERPMALIILAHWCVPVHRVTPQWFISGWAESAVRAIALILPSEWMSALQWPVNEMKLTGIFREEEVVDSHFIGA